MRAPDAVAIQGALALHRTRKIRSRSALKNQIHSHLDLVFPGLSDALWNPIESKAGRIMLDEGLTPRRVRRMGRNRLGATLAPDRGRHLTFARLAGSPL
jgi:hypothetical protein